METLIRELLIKLGEDPEREGLERTPMRVARTFHEFTKGYHEDPEPLFRNLMPIEASSDLVLLRDLNFISLCEHHLMPFFGTCHIAYLPQKKIIGFSKLVDLISIFSRRLQIQERLTKQIAACIHEHLDPLGIMVVMEAIHLCMFMERPDMQNTRIVTTSYLGNPMHQPKLSQFAMESLHPESFGKK